MDDTLRSVRPTIPKLRINLDEISGSVAYDAYWGKIG